MRPLPLLLLALLPALAADPPAKKEPRQLEVHLAVDERWMRDPWSKSEWKPCRTQAFDWTFLLAWEVKHADAKSVSCAGELRDFRGTWADQTDDDKTKPDVNVSFAPGDKGDPWKQALAGFSGTKFSFELGPQGGVLKVEGITAAARARFDVLSGDKATRALAKDLALWFTDEAFKRILGGVFLPTGPLAKGATTFKRRAELPCPRLLDYEEEVLTAPEADAGVTHDGEDLRLDAPFEHGKLLPEVEGGRPEWYGQPGHHSFGIEQKGDAKALVGPQGQGLKESLVTHRVHSRWDNYRMGSKADRYDRTTTLTLSARTPGTASVLDPPKQEAKPRKEEEREEPPHPPQDPSPFGSGGGFP